jgi:hypothetical protein
MYIDSGSALQQEKLFQYSPQAALPLIVSSTDCIWIVHSITTACRSAPNHAQPFTTSNTCTHCWRPGLYSQRVAKAEAQLVLLWDGCQSRATPLQHHKDPTPHKQRLLKSAICAAAASNKSISTASKAATGAKPKEWTGLQLHERCKTPTEGPASLWQTQHGNTIADAGGVLKHAYVHHLL